MGEHGNQLDKGNTMKIIDPMVFMPKEGEDGQMPVEIAINNNLAALVQRVDILIDLKFKEAAGKQRIVAPQNLRVK